MIEQCGLDRAGVLGDQPECRLRAHAGHGPRRARGAIGSAFAQTMEQMTGLRRGSPASPTIIPLHPARPGRSHRGHCTARSRSSPRSTERDRTGRGVFVEAPMVEAALNVTAEQVLEQAAFGNTMMRMGNRSPYAAPQGLYAG